LKKERLLCNPPRGLTDPNSTGDRRRSAFALVFADVGSSAAESSPSGGEGLQSVAAVGEPVVKAAAKHAKLVHVQILRAVAASLVVADHTYGALVYRKVPVAADMPAADLCGSLGVAAFFVLSGLIMMRQSAGRFGSWQDSVLFAYRRVTRIFPMYWIATYLWFRSTLTWGLKFDHAKEQMVGSLLFLPNVYSTSYRLMPLLQPGWTLNYEMWFYLLFALALLLPERAGIGLLVATLFGLVIVGGRVHLGGRRRGCSFGSIPIGSCCCSPQA
jgi:peptidoglycan/LPS O-acetylase OafA/YrhL